MGNLLSSLLSSATAMRTLEKALSTTQNNVANASTPGFAKQRLSLVAQPMLIEQGLAGGVLSGSLLDSRNVFAERNVRNANELASFYQQKRSSLEQVEPIFEVGPDSGLGGAFNRFFQSASALAVSPSDPVARQLVINRADSLAQSFQVAATGLAESSRSTAQNIRDTVAEINRLAGTIRDLNVARRRSPSNSDPSVDAGYANALEELSSLANVTALDQPDGSVTVLLGGQRSLVVGDQQYVFTADTGAVPARIVDPQGRDITATITRGSLASLLETNNRLLPSYQADLNSLAKTFADRVNATLNTGIDANGVAGANLFTYNAASEALSIKITNIQPAQIAAAAAGNPGGNGNALALAALATSPQVNNLSFTGFYGGLAAGLGRELSSARENAVTHQALVSQTRSIRSEISSVSLDEEAAYVLQFQKGYQAAAQLVTVLNELTQTVFGMLR
jgi:flagellar hook-associated protein 1 FlgK